MGRGFGTSLWCRSSADGARAVKWQAVLAATTLLSAVRARAAEVAWHAPAECADPRQTLEEAERLLGRQLVGVKAVDFDVSITSDREAQWTLTLATVDRGSGERRERVLNGASCSEVTAAAAVALAMVVDASEPSTLDRTQPASDPEQVVEPKATDQAHTAPPSSNKSASEARRRLGAAFSLSFAADIGSLPGVAPGAELGAALRSDNWQLAGLGALYLGSERQADGKGADLTLATGGALGCVRAASGPARPLLCAGGEAGWLAGTGTGVKNPRSAGAFWVAARVEAGLAVPVGRAFAVLGRLGAAVPLNRRHFVIDSDLVVHQPKLLAARLSLGVEFAP